MSVSKKKNSLGKYRKSIFIYSLTKLAGNIYRTFLAGFFGWILTSYEALVAGFSSSVIVKKLQTVSGYKIFHSAKNAKRWVAETYEGSFFLNFLRSISEKLLAARIASLGLFFFSYGFYLILIQVIKEYALPAEHLAMSGIIIGGAYMLFGTLFLFSKRNIAYMIYHSKILGRILFEFLGLRVANVAEAAENENKKGWNVPFILGMIFGLISIVLDPLMILAVILLCSLFYMIIVSPDRKSVV